MVEDSFFYVASTTLLNSPTNVRDLRICTSLIRALRSLVHVV
jgi:hypothetical protein